MMKTYARYFAAAIAALPLTVILTAPAAAATPDHVCSTVDSYQKVESGNMDDVVLGEGIWFCVKAAKQQSGLLVADGKTSLSGYVTWTNKGGQHPAVSHYVLYEDPEILPEPTTPAEQPKTEKPGTKAPAVPGKVDKPKVTKLVTKVQPLPHTGDAETIALAFAGVVAIGIGVAFYTAGRRK